MRLFGSGNQESPEQRQRREASVRSLEAGGLPLNAIDRLREQVSRQGTPSHIFTSDLSVNEMLLVREAGYQPLGQIMGSSVYHIGYQYLPSGYWSGSQELETITQAFYQARGLAMGRLLQEARMLGATGVVGVRLDRKRYEWGAGLIEFSAIGTAIRENDAPPSPTMPFLSDLSGQEFWTLRQAGYRPVGMAMGSCVFYQMAGWRTQWATSGGILSGSWSNMELTDYTRGVYTARSLAMWRMENEARGLGAEGVVGADVEIEVEPHEVEVNDQHRTDMIYNFTALGTAIAPFQGRWPVFHIQGTVPLTDG